MIRNYPKNANDVVCKMSYPNAVKQAMKKFIALKPFQGNAEERAKKIYSLHNDLCRAYEVQTTLYIEPVEVGNGESGCSFFYDNRICLYGLSVVTYLHEFGHALGKDEKEACRFSINLFRIFFPKSFSRCRIQGHMLLKMV